MKQYDTPAALEPLVGTVIGVSDWLTIDQPRIDAFAAVTGDDQWIHVDPRRAADSIFGSTVAHGFLTLSLIPTLLRSAHRIDGVRMVINYGLNRVRFPAPLSVDSRVRAQFTLQSLERVEGGVQMVQEVSLEREGSAKPVCVAESVLRLYL